MSQCKYVDLSKNPNVPCGYLAAAGSRYGYCPRHELLVPALEAERAKKEAAKRNVQLGERRDRMGRAGGRR